MSTTQDQLWILVADDELAHRSLVRQWLLRCGYQVFEAGDGVVAVETVRREKPALVLMDLRMPGLDGIAALRDIRSFDRTVPVIMLTAFGSIQSAVEAVKLGAYDYLQKPVDLEVLKQAVTSALDYGALLRQEPAAQQGEPFSGLIWKSPQMAEILDTVSRVAPSTASVLITGESGTGKEMIADAIHRLSARAAKPCIKVNCAALHEQLLESELFGHERGAFTGAVDLRKGRFELADGGTLLLDEIGDMAPTTQAKILRVLQSGTFERLGGTTTLKTDVRVIAATNHDLKQAIEQGKFRSDLFFRLSVVPIHLPPLRERREEIPALAGHFLRRFAAKNQRSISSISTEAMHALIRHCWPGNVRELENVIERAVILAPGDQLTPEVLPVAVRGGQFSRTDTAQPLTVLEQIERDAIIQAMLACQGNRTKAAEHLGMSRRSLYNKLKVYGIGD